MFSRFIGIFLLFLFFCSPVLVLAENKEEDAMDMEKKENLPTLNKSNDVIKDENEKIEARLKEPNKNTAEVVIQNKEIADTQGELKDLKKEGEKVLSDGKNNNITDNNEEKSDIKEMLKLPPVGEVLDDEKRNNNIESETNNKKEALQDKGSVIVLDVKTLNKNDTVNISNVVEDKATKNEDREKKIAEVVEEKKIIKLEPEKQKEEKKKDKAKTSSTLFTIFNKKKALKFNYKTAKDDDYSFLENADELKVIKQIITEQLNPEIKKKRIEEQRKKESMQAELEAIKANTSTLVEKKQEGGRVKRFISLKSLVYFNDKDWIVRVNKQIIPYKDKDNLKNDVVSILKVDKTSVVFVMNAADELLVKKVNDLIGRNVPYKNSYFVIRQKHKTYVAFKLYIGQRIELDTMRIER